jgi:large subunit ribosomal protein L13
MYYRHTGYLGGLKEISLEDLLAKKPVKALEFAVSGMLPKNKLRA